MVKTTKLTKEQLRPVPPWPLKTKDLKFYGFKKVSKDVAVRDNGDGTFVVAEAKTKRKQ